MLLFLFSQCDGTLIYSFDLHVLINGTYYRKSYILSAFVANNRPTKYYKTAVILGL